MTTPVLYDPPVLCFNAFVLDEYLGFSAIVFDEFLILLVANLSNIKLCNKNETLAYGYPSKSTVRAIQLMKIDKSNMTGF